MVREVLLAGLGRAALGLPVVVDDDVSGRPEEVAAQTSRDLRGGVLPYLEDGFLNDVVRLMGVGRAAENEALQSSSMVAVDRSHHVFIQRHSHLPLSAAPFAYTTTSERKRFSPHEPFFPPGGVVGGVSAGPFRPARQRS